MAIYHLLYIQAFQLIIGNVLNDGQPIWKLVSDAADKIGKNVFSASDIVKKVHETNPDVPDDTIKTIVVGMTPNHPARIKYPISRNNHPYFFFLKNRKYRLLEQKEKDSY